MVDLLCRISTKELVAVELQFSKQIDFFQRMMANSMGVVFDRFKRGERYNKLVKVYVVSLVYFELGRFSDWAYTLKNSLKA